MTTPKPCPMCKKLMVSRHWGYLFPVHPHHMMNSRWECFGCGHVEVEYIRQQTDHEKARAKWEKLNNEKAST